MQRINVLFPLPEGPMMTNFSPSFTSRFTSFKTDRFPNDLHRCSTFIMTVSAPPYLWIVVCKLSTLFSIKKAAITSLRHHCHCFYSFLFLKTFSLYTNITNLSTHIIPTSDIFYMLFMIISSIFLDIIQILDYTESIPFG